MCSTVERIYNLRMIMTKKESLKVFEKRNVRTVWDDEEEKWYFSMVDVVGVLTDSPNPNNYWKVLKHRLLKEGNESVTNCNQLKLLSADGKRYRTDVADTTQLMRLIQSIPSPKAEPFKQWMAEVASTRIDQIQDPELSINQAIADYRRLGYSEPWINQRLKSMRVLVWHIVVGMPQKVLEKLLKKNSGIQLSLKTTQKLSMHLHQQLK